MANYIIKLNEILYHSFLSMASFRFCETYLLHIKAVLGKETISWRLKILECKFRLELQEKPNGSFSA